MLEADRIEHLLLGVDPEEGLLVTMPLNEGTAWQLRRDPELRLAREEIGQQHRAVSKRRRILRVGHQIVELVLEHGGAARLEDHDRKPFGQVRAHAVQDAIEVAARVVEHAEVVERPPAAEPVRRDDDLVAGGLEHVDGRHQGVGEEVIVEGVGPEDDALAACRRARAATTEHRAERLRRERRDLRLERDAREHLHERACARRLREEVHEPW